MKNLFDEFPFLRDDCIIIKKMVEEDVDALMEITDNPNIYKYIPPFLYKKSRGNLLAAIRNLGARDFNSKKMIIAGIYLCAEPDRLTGLAEMFDYKKRSGQMTIGYRLNELYWHRGIATEAVKLMTNYLCNDMGIQTLQAFVMPENVFSEKALLKNGFTKENHTVQEKNWGGKDIVDLNVFTYSRK
ncbi:MAG: GNAT family N-acetyltransferase [Oscillospiraceae bacterium]|nr:GNAT family N-acetyltransferase [Oscillospiraceae bacterium]